MATIDTSGWTTEQKQALASAEAELAAEEQAIAELAAVDEARRRDPARVLEEHRAALLDRRRERLRRLAELEGEEAYRAACARYGSNRAAIVRTDEGPVVLRPFDDAELRAGAARHVALRRPGQTDDDPMNEDQLGAAQDALAKAVLFPPAERFKELVRTYPGLWAALYEARDAIISGQAEARRKKG